MITEKDQRAIEFVRQFGAATTSQLMQVYFQDQKELPSQAAVITRRRLKKLVDDKVLKRKRYHLNMEYIYYTRWSSQIQHKIAVADVYLKLLSMGGEILYFGNEIPLGNLRPDAVIQYKYRNKMYWFFLEAQLNGQFNQQKYEDYYTSREYTKLFSINGISTFPRVLIVSPRKPLLQASRIRFIYLPLDLKGIERIFD